MTKLHITIQDNEHRDDLNNEDSRDNTSTHLAIPTNTDPILLPQPQVLKTGAYTAQDGDRVCGGGGKDEQESCPSFTTYIRHGCYGDVHGGSQSCRSLRIHLNIGDHFTEHFCFINRMWTIGVNNGRLF